MLLAALTFAGWTSGPGDASVAGWIIFGGYLAVAFLAWGTARRETARGLDPFPWLALGVACGFLALSKQLDLSDAITILGRGLARSEGWYEHRRSVQFGLLSGLALAAGAAVAWIFRRPEAEWRRHRLTWAGMILLVTFVGMRTASFHYLDTLLRTRIGGMRLHALVELAGIGLVFLSALRTCLHPLPPGRSIGGAQPPGDPTPG